MSPAEAVAQLDRLASNLRNLAARPPTARKPMFRGRGAYRLSPRRTATERAKAIQTLRTEALKRLKA